MMKRAFARIILISNLIFFTFAVAALASSNEQNTPNYTDGEINYYLSAPDTYTTEIYMLDTEHIINITDGETVIIEWETEMPEEITNEYADSFAYNGVTVNTSLTISKYNTLILHYSKDAFIEGQSFISGELIQKVSAVEHMSAGGLVPFSYQFGFTDTITRDFISGNFSTVSEENILSIPLFVSANEITNQYGEQSMQTYSKLSEYYAELKQYEDLEMDIILPFSFIAETIEETIPVAAFEISDDIPNNTTIVEIIDEIPQDVVDIPQEPLEELPPPTTAEVITGAISSAVAVGVISSVAASAGSSLSGAAAAGTTSASAAMQQTIIQSAAVSAGKGALSFISDVIKGLRDMFMDEGRAHASGKVTDNIHKD